MDCTRKMGCGCEVCSAARAEREERQRRNDAAFRDLARDACEQVTRQALRMPTGIQRERLSAAGEGRKDGGATRIAPITRRPDQAPAMAGGSLPGLYTGGAERKGGGPVATGAATRPLAHSAPSDPQPGAVAPHTVTISAADLAAWERTRVSLEQLVSGLFERNVRLEEKLLNTFIERDALKEQVREQDEETAELDRKMDEIETAMGELRGQVEAAERQAREQARDGVDLVRRCRELEAALRRKAG